MILTFTRVAVNGYFIRNGSALTFVLISKEEYSYCLLENIVIANVNENIIIIIFISNLYTL